MQIKISSVKPGRYGQFLMGQISYLLSQLLKVLPGISSLGAQKVGYGIIWKIDDENARLIKLVYGEITSSLHTLVTIYGKYFVEHLKSRFQKFHQDKGFSIFESFPLVTTEDPTVLFTNATITPFKKMFTGEMTAVNFALVQKCLRLGGTSGNVDTARLDINYTSFFEMLGSGYFGVSHTVALDYFIEMLDALGLQMENMIFSSIGSHPFASALISSALDSNQIRIIEDPKEVKHEWSFGEGDLHGVGVIAWFASEGYGKNPDLSDCLQIGRIVDIDGISEGESVRPLAQTAFDVGLGMRRVERALTGESEIPLMPWRTLSKQFKSSFNLISDGDAHYMANLCRVIDELISEGLMPGNKKHAHVLRKVIRSLIEEVWLQSHDLVNVVDALRFFIDVSKSKDMVASALLGEESSLRRILSQVESTRRKHPDMTFNELQSTYGIRPNLLSLM
jgi:alanyl-tRNA synthetase